MKMTNDEKQVLSDTIDGLNEGLDSIIALYNESETDKPIIDFEDDVISAIEQAKEKYGDKNITDHLNNIMREILSMMT
ncbi:atypical membrane-integrating protein (Mistic protein) [Cytobacillus sp. IB215665]|uniref:atypical membrane-integrating protein (Mistic protein) n=1 Tax=Cytobacillus sp. IB215665 TaxID=3097357 RepID=UPI002A12AEB0|nr:atypical membrane-integrating protein (Mistic protein) [Cytobacillus sp. IB215665]MDX8365881.1 atypical membrane-integrating protein (Mistic protein) [Cytobacillus sp. IB215665]